MKTGTTKFTNVCLIYDNGSFAIAKGIWDNQHSAIGCRWYENGGIGYPQTYGKPQWFILPEEVGKMIEMVLSIGKSFKMFVTNVI